MEIINGIEIIDLALYLPKQRILAIADVHMGYEEALNKQGILMPRFQFKEVILRLETIFKTIKPKLNKIVINGDIKHEFGKISETEWRNTLKLLDFLAKHCDEIILIKGNHDTILGPIARKRNVKVVEHYDVGKVVFIHGDKLVPNKAKTIIIGHEHPAISFKQRTDKFKCFLRGKWKGKQLIVMPSFNMVTEGTDITQEKLLSPYLTNISDFGIFVVGEQIMNFGKVKEMRKL